MTEHSLQQLGFDKNARSISVADPLSTTLVGSCTINLCEVKLDIILCNSVIAPCFLILFYSVTLMLITWTQPHLLLSVQRTLNKVSKYLLYLRGVCGEIGDNEISLPNYSSVRLDRSRHGGGILMYIKDGIPFSVVASGPAGLEIIFVSVLLSNNRRVYLGTSTEPRFDNTYNVWSTSATYSFKLVQFREYTSGIE